MANPVNPYRFFVIRTTGKLPKPLVLSHFAAVAAQLARDGAHDSILKTTVVVSADGEPCNVIGIEHPDLIAAFRSYLKQMGIEVDEYDEVKVPLVQVSISDPALPVFDKRLPFVLNKHDGK